MFPDKDDLYTDIDTEATCPLLYNTMTIIDQELIESKSWEFLGDFRCVHAKHL